MVVRRTGAKIDRFRYRGADSTDRAQASGPIQTDESTTVIPGRPKGPSPEPMFQRPVFMGSGLAAARRSGMTRVRGFKCQIPTISVALDLKFANAAATKPVRTSNPPH